MSLKKCHLTYALGTLVISAALVIVGPVSAEDSTSIDLSTQPHLKSWSNIIPNAAKRFVVLPDFNSEAVLDRETGLVWERSPSTNPTDWINGIRTCWLQKVGGRMGWHLPTIEELASLVDPTVLAPGPGLPPGHPFQNVQQDTYWSTTEDVRPGSGQAWVVHFHLPGQTADTVIGTSRFVWCVRGGTHGDKYK